MNQIKKPSTIIKPALLLVCATLFTLLGLGLLTKYDNKYTAKVQIAQDNKVLLPENGVYYLVDSWELYPDCLLTPADFSDSALMPRYTTWAGEYPNLALFHKDGNPYGTATYRLILQGSGQVSLYLQEPLCAARIFVDGRDLGGPGEVSGEDYHPLIRDTVYSFSVNGESELIIQTANYSHYYGGLWFPPAIGSADSISHLIASRMIFYGLLCFSALALALFCMVLWLGKSPGRDKAAFYFGLLCLSFALRICYPFLRLWGVPLVRTLYALEDMASLLGIYCMVRIALLLFLPEKYRRLDGLAATLSLGMCGVGGVVPLLVLPAFPSFTLWYGSIVSWYKVLAAVFLIGTAFQGCVLGRRHTRSVLTAATVNGVCLLYGVLAIGTLEPIRGGWPEEYGAFGMVLAFAGLMVGRSRGMAAENLRLTEHLQAEVEDKTRHLTLLLKERGQLITELGHDMKSPLTALSNMTQIIRLNDIMLDGDVREMIQGIEEKCEALADRLRSMQEFAGETAAPAHMEPISLNQFLRDFHRSNQPVVELTGPDFLCQLTSLPCKVLADRDKLSRALENLVFNAGDFTPPEGKITLSLVQEETFAVICVSDTGCGIPETDLARVFHRYYTTRKSEGGQGLGLAITRAIILEHKGEIHVESRVGEGSIFTIRLPLV